MTTKLSFHITGMDCADCARTIQRGVSQLAGVEHCELNFSSEVLRVRGNVDGQTVRRRVQELGYNIRDPSQQHDSDASQDVRQANFLRFLWRRPDTRPVLLSAVLILPGLLLHELLPGLRLQSPWIDLSSIAAMLIAGYPAARRGWFALRINRQITINALMTLAAVGAVLIGAYTEAGVVMVLFALGEALEGFSVERSRQSIRSLMRLAPEQALRLDAHQEHAHEILVPVRELEIGDRILVKPGSRIPMDGRIVAGASSVNQAPITGESQLIAKQEGDQVFAGTINGEGSLQVEVTRLAAENTISRMIRLVQQAQEKQAPAQRFVDRFAGYYTPLVVGLAVLVATVPVLFFGQPLLNSPEGGQGWLYRGLVLLVVACPCALVISTPVTLVSAMSNAARSGILFKGGLHLETLSQAQAIAFDKTGTLTRGQPTVINVRSVDCSEQIAASCLVCNDLLALASAVEQRSEHPIADAVVHEARHRGLSHRYPGADSVEALTGRGVSGQVGGHQVLIGSHPYFDVHVPHDQHCAQVARADQTGFTTMLVSKDDRYQGYITVADTVRSSSRSVVASLRKLGLRTLVMLTGDNWIAARSVADQVGVTDFVAGCLPEDKVRVIEEMKAVQGPVAMVGDGINDAPALAAASVGIAIGSSAQAMETADITLMGDNLSQLPFAIQLSRAAMRTVKFNIFLSVLVKLLFLFLVLFGLGTMWLAVLADMGASILVTLNGMRLFTRPRMHASDGSNSAVADLHA